jgi:hypothetical protein
MYYMEWDWIESVCIGDKSIYDAKESQKEEKKGRSFMFDSIGEGIV